MSEVRVNFVFNSSLTEGQSRARLNWTFDEALTEWNNTVRWNWAYDEALTEWNNHLRLNWVLMESLVPVPVEPFMIENVFPGFGNSITDPTKPAAADPFHTPLPGLTIEVSKTPLFKTKISESVSGREIRNAMADQPRWEIKLSYEFLEDRSGAESSLKTIVGFFLAMRGSFDSFRFKDPDDYLVQNVHIGTGDGGTTEFPLVRSMGGFSEIIGQVDDANTVVISRDITETSNVPAPTGPYTITVANSGSFVQDKGVTIGGNPLTRVEGAPGNNQYSVAAGVYTFNVAQAEASASITYSYAISSGDYEIVMPNRLVFDTAPGEGVEIYGSYQFYYVCRFLEDQLEFEKFYDKLWNLQECSFKSLIL